MAMNRPAKKFFGKYKTKKTEKFITTLKVGDPVMVITGGNPKRGRELKGKVGKIRGFLPKRNRVLIDGLNLVVRHKRARSVNEPAGKIRQEGSVAISNVMYYVEAIKRPVRLASTVLENGKKVRAYRDPETKKLVAIDEGVRA
jgi:large subunit ribosomal protein L24